MKLFRKLRKFSLLLLLLPLLSCTIEDIFESSGGGGTSENTIIAGLKEALNIGIKTAADSLHITNGYMAKKAIALVLPSDVQEVLNYTSNLKTQINSNAAGLLLMNSLTPINNLLNMESKMIVALNRAAEEAAPLSLPIFSNAITSLTITDGMNILNGDSVAATSYLKTETFSSLVNAYSPFVDSALEKVDAITYWTQFNNYYSSVTNLYAEYTTPEIRKLFGGEPPKLTRDLGAYTTGKALDGLFYMVGQQEYLIRKDPLQRVTDILKEVFGLQDDK